MPPARRFLSLLIALAAICGLVVPTAQARTDAGEVQTIWRLLDYVAVDYGGAIANGEVTSPVEYAEMTEFSATVRKGIEALPASPARASSEVIASIPRAGTMTIPRATPPAALRA